MPPVIVFANGDFWGPALPSTTPLPDGELLEVRRIEKPWRLPKFILELFGDDIAEQQATDDEDDLNMGLLTRDLMTKEELEAEKAARTAAHTEGRTACKASRAPSAKPAAKRTQAARGTNKRSKKKSEHSVSADIVESEDKDNEMEVVTKPKRNTRKTKNSTKLEPHAQDLPPSMTARTPSPHRTRGSRVTYGHDVLAAASDDEIDGDYVDEPTTSAPRAASVASDVDALVAQMPKNLIDLSALKCK